MTACTLSPAGRDSRAEPACTKPQPRPPHLLVPGTASGPLLYTTTPLSFWGGTDPASGRIIDVHHPLSGQCMAGHILALPSGRGSCSGSLGVLECIVSGRGPRALVLADADEIMALGALVAGTVFGRGIPVAVVGHDRYARLAGARSLSISAGVLNASLASGTLAIPLVSLESLATQVQLTEGDQAMLAGKMGQGRQEAMELVLAMARMYGAPSLTSVTRAHIDAVIYVGPATLSFAQHFAQIGAQFAVPTTINAVSAPREWEALGVPPSEAGPALALPAAYESLGAVESRTCAPYFLPSPPGVGESVGWAESNAVVFANSVLGARTLKYPDMLDVAVALTGRAPLAGAHVDAARMPRVRIDVDVGKGADGGSEPGSVFWPLLGYAVGTVAGHDVVVVCGLEDTSPRLSDLKAFGAAFGTSSGSPMFHIRGVTPEAPAHVEFDVERTVDIGSAELASAWEGLNSARDEDVGLVAVGNPHLAVDEFGELAALVRPLLDRGLRAEVPFVLTAGRHVVSEAEKAGYLEPLRRFGATVVEDACWCMINAPVVPDVAQSVATNSAKYAHYGPGGVGKPMYFASTAECVQAAVNARCTRERPSWLA
ncbi:hypothetical protein CspeluHIS016_0600620 [Cutaneotrichosporon spelunceum]|uniref:DUF521-domain-containing protein n=1 Tax=Cutaneotrichosporon spelunceum TaxID=1672016 RepID=A0AAD3TXA5_9TREE|nr:hypothetical protein CspeluHIS016_0600620 [Cutaneotrichosporon spelunceum]